MIVNEIANQVTRKLNDFRSNSSLQIQEAINTAITDRVLHFIENSLVAHGRANLTMEDHRARGYRIPQEHLISPWRSRGPVGYKGTPKLQTLRKRKKMGFSRAVQTKQKLRLI